MSRRALIHEADLRRWAKIAREEGVGIRGRVAPDGGVTISIEPPGTRGAASDDDLDNAIDGYLGK